MAAGSGAHGSRQDAAAAESGSNHNDSANLRSVNIFTLQNMPRHADYTNQSLETWQQQYLLHEDGSTPFSATMEALRDLTMQKNGKEGAMHNYYDAASGCVSAASKICIGSRKKSNSGGIDEIHSEFLQEQYYQGAPEPESS